MGGSEVGPELAGAGPEVATRRDGVRRPLGVEAEDDDLALIGVQQRALVRRDRDFPLSAPPRERGSGGSVFGAGVWGCQRREHWRHRRSQPPGA